jgi:Fe-S-cluster-containing dehydrogenase component
MARMKFLCDSDRCIECNACSTACKNENEVPWGMVRRRVVTLNDGVQNKEKSIAISCMHCTDAPCIAVCPVSCIYQTDIGVVLHNKDTCIGCGYCFYACPFGKQGGGFLHDNGENPPARKFNAGQKFVFWGMTVGGAAAAARQRSQPDVPLQLARL